jgi:hypothetical protein
MGRIICRAIVALVFSSGAVFAQHHGGGRWDGRFAGFYRYDPSCFAPAVVTLPVPYPLPNPVSYPVVTNVVASSPTYLIVGNNSSARPQLVFKDGTSYFVSDYWRTDDQLHFATMEEGGTKTVPHTVPFDTLDLQRTKDAGAAEGFRFVLRDKPLEQWLAHRGEQPARARARR